MYPLPRLARMAFLSLQPNFPTSTLIPPFKQLVWGADIRPRGRALGP